MDVVVVFVLGVVVGAVVGFVGFAVVAAGADRDAGS